MSKLDFYLAYDPNWCGAAVYCGCLVARICESDVRSREILDQLTQQSVSKADTSIWQVNVNDKTLGLFYELVEHLKPVQ